jgi:predicted TIM-barrel fold metal-dependent hydrolase
MPFIHASPHYFAEVMAELLWWLGPDRLTFSSDYALWSPKWIIDKFMAFDFPEDIKQSRGLTMDLETKKKILGLNIAKLYDLSVPAEAAGAQVAVTA